MSLFQLTAFKRRISGYVTWHVWGLPLTLTIYSDGFSLRILCFNLEVYP